jgi:hypothetical protein
MTEKTNLIKDDEDQVLKTAFGISTKTPTDTLLEVKKN